VSTASQATLGTKTLNKKTPASTGGRKSLLEHPRKLPMNTLATPQEAAEPDPIKDAFAARLKKRDLTYSWPEVSRFYFIFLV
jgi:hypothetical protein